MKTTIQINPFFNPDQTRLNNDFIPDLIISSIVIKQDFNPDQSWFQSGSIMTTYPDLSWIQSRLIKTSIRIHHHFKPEFNHDYLSGFIKTSIKINAVFNPDQTRLNNDFIPDLIISSIVIKQDFNPDQSWFQSGSIMTTYPDLLRLQSGSIMISIRFNHDFSPHPSPL
jgi:hypothetical protein